MIKPYAVIIGAVLLVCAGCFIPVASGDPGNAGDVLSGSWSTDWGALQLSQSGSTVTGTYTHDSGKIIGTLSGHTLTGTWSEAPSYAGDQDSGKFVWTISDDFNSFTGTWGYGSSSTGGGWSGTREGGVQATPTETRNTIDLQPVLGSTDALPVIVPLTPGENEKISRWITNRKSVPYGWIVDEGKGIIYRDIYEGNANPPSIPLSWVLGTSDDPSKNLIFSTEVPEEKHTKYVEDIAKKLESDETVGTILQTWYDASDADKRSVVKKIASYVQQELSLAEHEIQFVSGPLIHPVTQEKVSGYYDQDKKTIIISADPGGQDWMNDPKTVIDTLAHEMKHRQQYESPDSMESDEARAASAANLASADSYKLNTENDAYFYGQYIESDAYSFGDKMQRMIRGFTS